MLARQRALAQATHLTRGADGVAFAAVIPVGFDIDAESGAVGKAILAGEGAFSKATNLTCRAKFPTGPAVLAIVKEVNTLVVAIGSVLVFAVVAITPALDALADFSNARASFTSTSAVGINRVAGVFER